VNAYYVEPESDGCEKCGHGAMWNVVGPDGTAISITYGDREDADDMAEQLSRAYEDGEVAGRAGIVIERDNLRGTIDHVRARIGARDGQPTENAVAHLIAERDLLYDAIHRLHTAGIVWQIDPMANPADVLDRMFAISEAAPLP
jgi:hypothetical protein